ncbi:GumC family protein [Neptunicoccus cionae]|uniref:Polysaccharide chain length determinant N-terminal domain-containing protein n=1 Tax=Neptunicoccus cionae TaxID=2035344 RepID=A0A916R5D7_9RHOB|nr:Wzz/FepE/Etk N-terminal domain-containing protein [Amylibacter cionae]GGA29044.1 hypothetical protein GCM10011498_32700 [Amylibacter cionae]
MDFKFYLLVFWRRFPYFFILLCLGIGAGVAAALLLPPVYVAEARLVVESEQIPDKLAESTVQTDASEQLQIIEQRIMTRDKLLEMANRLGIYRGAGTPANPMTPDEKVRDLRDRVQIRTFGGSVQRGQSTATVVIVGFEAPTAKMAAAVTNEIVTLMLQENVEMRTTVSGQTLDFFTQEVARLEQSLAQTSGQILKFQEANEDALPDSLSFRRNEQTAEQERLLELEREENQLRDRRNRMVALYERTGDIGRVEEDARTAEELQLQELKDRLATSVAVLSLDNPRVVVLRAQIAALEEVVAEQQAALAMSAVNEDGTQLTPYELQLADIDGQLEFIAEQKQQINSKLEALKASIAATPGNALTLDTLTRNLQNLRLQYDQAVANRARAETGDMIEALSKGQRITVIEQAIAPSKPQSPNRKKIAAMGVAAGLGLGFGFIALLELLNTAVRRPTDLVNGLDITPIVTLPYMRTRGQIWRRWLIILTSALVVLVGIPAGLWYIDANIRSLQPILDALLARTGLG